MAIVQHNKGKVHPVMDYRELNEYFDAFTGNADVCSAKLQDWRQQGVHLATLDLRRTYLQVHVLWPYKTVMNKEKWFDLTRLGFALNVATIVMKSITDTVRSQVESAGRATSASVDDVYVNTSIIFAEHVRVKLVQYGMMCKDPEHLKVGTPGL